MASGVHSDGSEAGAAWCTMAELRDPAYLARGRKTRRGTIREVGFLPAMLPVVDGIDGGMSRRPWDLRQRHLRWESWWLVGSRHGRRGCHGEGKKHLVLLGFSEKRKKRLQALNPPLPHVPLFFLLHSPPYATLCVSFLSSRVHPIFNPCTSILCLLSTPLYLLHAPHLFLNTPPTCDTHAPPYICLLFLGLLLCTPTNHVPPYFCFPLSSFLINLFLFIYLLFFHLFSFFLLFLKKKKNQIFENY